MNKNELLPKLDEWIDEQKYQEYSDNTLKQYRANVLKFINWLPNNEPITKQTTMDYKKYLLALIISKLSIVYFWGFIGTTFVESITDIGVLIKICLILFITFILSRIVINKFKIQ